MTNLNTQKLKLVFDLDNTLLFRDQAMLDCIEYVFKLQLSTSQKVAIERQDEQGHSDRIQFCTWLQTFLEIPTKATTIWSSISANIGDFVRINKATNSVLSTLQKQYECILFTNGGIDNQSRKIAQTGLNHFFQTSHIFISEALGCKKPELKAFQLVQSQFKAGTRFCMVGDHWENDILGAKNAGWYVIHLTENPLPINSERIEQITCLTMLSSVLNKWK